ncbi:acetyl-CoA carboxylase biotin carboxyl carrier protein [Alicycliphilus denitrificans]|jgi:acetyl-CoA carboxylase biotin carboxyl carrier protein|uniref:acetyl-CoA carboxylase biotin carboxyl carrier protein n=1 Tax=Alicycliphilus denitrificans TaxID=179636 RepID=UPI0001D9E7BC|nr:biotin/lipoyl-containing protein [Alicycliphilus denitrificans]ADU98772.1 acetyl-CoA carboxylase, biotin carboxyl carrier protein [Alicycliphilus denitrificans BC]GAO20368.1 acetyl-CoA carboxylase, biotin carboxyl carrier protein [Alicycliphilus sp. B1]
MAFDIARIKSLITAAAEAQVDELELSEAGMDVRILRLADSVQLSAPGTAVAGQPAQTPSAPLAVDRQVQAESAASPPPVHTLTAFMAGTFYRSITPGGEPLVQEGAAVAPGTVLGVLESMKIMNEISSESQGIVKRILCENAQVVSAGQPLFELQEC